MLAESAFLIGPERLARLVIGVAVQSGLRVQRAVIGNLQLVDGIVVDILDRILGFLAFSYLVFFGDGCGQRAERQSHEDAVEPYLVGVDGLVPEHLVGNGAWLILQLLHHGLHGFQVLSLRPILIHTGYEVTSTDVVEVVVQDVIAANVTLFVNHGVGIFLTILANVLATIAQIGVQHAFQLNTHDIAPLGTVGEIEQIGFRHTLHLAIGQPLGIVLVRRILENQRTIDRQVVVGDVLCKTNLMDRLAVNTIELAVAYRDIVDGIGKLRLLITHNHDAILRLLTSNVLHQHIADNGVETAAANLAWIIVRVDFQDGFLALSYRDIAHVDVLDDATTAGVRLDAEHTVQIGRVHLAVLCKDVLATT